MFVRAANPIWYMVDHTGNPLNDEYYAFFLTNTLPYLPQNVYRDPQGMTVWTGDVVQFSPAGTLPDNLYFDPNLVYRIEIRHGNSQTDELIWEINNFVPNGGGGNIENDLSILTAENQITNPQFATISFLSPLTITVAGTYEVAPGWELVLTGSGTTTLTQNILSGDQDIVNNPPYSLRINNNGWTDSSLIQTFNHNGALWAAGAVTMSITARAQTNAQTISLIYSPSSPGVPQVVATGLLGTGDYQVISGAIDLPDSVNTGLSTVAYTDMIVQLPPTGIVDLTNIQVIGQSSPLPTNFDPTIDIPLYQQETVERGIDHSFNVYKEPLARKPMPSYLVGWDFPFNPAQRGTAFGPIASGANTSFYAWDQTIVFQSANSGITTTRVTNNDFSISASVNSQAAIIQYLPATQAQQLLSNIISVYIDAFSAHGGGSGAIPITISLWATTDMSLPSVGSNNSLVATLDANGKPATFHGNWTEVAPLNGQEAAYTLVSGQMAFDGWWNNNGNALVSTATYFAIVIGTATITALDSIVFRSVSLQRGSIASPPSPQTPDDVLRECQAYWEQSYVPGVAAGSVTTLGRITNIQNFTSNGSNIAIRAGIFHIDWKSVKNTVPAISFYAPSSGTVDTVDVQLWNGGASISTANPSFSANWTLAEAASIYGANYNPASFTALVNPAAVGSAPQATMLYHYTADSRLGA